MISKDHCLLSHIYLLMIVDKHSCFMYAFPCLNMHMTTAIGCLELLFSLGEMLSFIHSNQSKTFMYKEFSQKRLASNKIMPYHQMGNVQVERFYGTIWKAILLVLRSGNLSKKHWELILPRVLHSLRLLLCIATNATPL